MIIVIDCSVFIAYFASKGKGTAGDLIKSVFQNKYTLATSNETYNELRQTIQKPSIKNLPHYNTKKAAKLIVWYKYKGKKHDISDISVPVTIRNKSDNIYLALSMRSNASSLITYDEDLLTIKSMNSTSIVKPKQFLLQAGR